MKVVGVIAGLLLIFIMWVMYVRALFVGWTEMTLGVVVGAIIVLVSLTVSKEKKPSTLGEKQPVKEIIKEKEVIKERVVVKIPCSHCGTLFPQESIRCPNCGAPLRR